MSEIALVAAMRPKSIGEIRIRRQGDRIGQEIDHRFFSDPQDARVLVEGIKLARAIFAAAPRDRILVETDAPYLAPPPHRGKRNEPGSVGRLPAGL